jgi:effector-binding domain-containing protein
VSAVELRRMLKLRRAEIQALLETETTLFAIVDLPAVERAAVIIHHGSMDDVMPTGQALARWIDANGYRSAGYSREVTLEWSPDPEQWVTELQQPIHTTGY